MKVPTNALKRPVRIGRALIILSFSFLLLFGVFASTAAAITRDEVLSRATSWVKRRVSYSQHRTFDGYRRDCSGFVSMAWKLDTSYSSRSIASQARRISVSTLKPGDAVLTPGHVALFGGWKNKARREYIAIEQTTWGSHAMRHVRRIPRRAVALRRRGIAEQTRVGAAASRTSAAAAAVASATETGTGSGTISTTFTVASIAAALEEPADASPLISARSWGLANVLV